MEDLGSYGAAPASVLNSRTRRFLARWLDPSTAAVNSEEYPQFWEGLAELMEFDYQDLKNFERAPHPTLKLLEVWTQHPEHTVGELWGLLEKLEVYHILETELRNMIIHDIKAHQSREFSQQKSLEASSPPVQVNIVDTQSSDMTDHWASEYTNMTVGEVETGRPELFDAFVCYSYPDLKFVKQMIQHLEGLHGLKLCIHARDLLVGTSQHTVTAKLIEERCKKMLIVLSPDFLKSPECDFQTKFAHALSPGSRSKKLVPVIIVPGTRIPNILRHITVADSTKCDLRDWFWGRLAASLKEQKPVIDPFDDIEIEIPPPHDIMPTLMQDMPGESRDTPCRELTSPSLSQPSRDTTCSPSLSQPFQPRREHLTHTTTPAPHPVTTQHADTHAPQPGILPLFPHLEQQPTPCIPCRPAPGPKTTKRKKSLLNSLWKK